MPAKPSPKLSSSPVAARIEEVRSSRGMTQTAFAEALGTKPSSVSKWEAGRNRPSPDIFVRIARLAEGEAKLFFLEEAGLPLQYFEGAPMLSDVHRVATAVVADSLRERSTTLGDQRVNDTPCTIHLLKNAEKLGDSDAAQAANVELALSLPSAWFPAEADIQAVRFASPQPGFITGDLIALVDVSRRDKDRLIGCVVVVRSPNGPEPMKLRKDAGTYLLVPLIEDADHPVRVLKQAGNWSIIGKVLKWIGDAPSPRK
jgi:transcriptional regulator with XRE-family HTH domain